MSSYVSFTAKDYLQNLYENLGYEDNIIWDSYKRGQEDKLKSKILYIMGVPEELDEVANLKEKNIHKQQVEAVEKICESIWNQAKYTGGRLFMGISCVCAVPKDKLSVDEAHMSEDFAVHPVFRVMKCINDVSTEDCCMIFVDTHGRVYQNWESYQKKNVLPSCSIVAPKRGILKGKENTAGKRVVEVETFHSPAATLTGKLVNFTDKTCVVVGLGATVTLVGTCFFPPLLCALPYIGRAGVGSTVWAIGRSVERLVDRSKHEENLSFTDKQARALWLTTVSGTLGLAAGASVLCLGSAARCGFYIPKTMETVVDGLNITTMGLGGVALGNGMFNIGHSLINKEHVSALEAAQVCALLFMFFHSVCNFQRAKTIIEVNKMQTFNDFKEKFDLMKKSDFERFTGTTDGKADFIRSLKNSKSYDNILLEKSLYVVGSATKLLFNLAKSPSDQRTLTLALKAIAKDLNENAFKKFNEFVKDIVTNYREEFERRARRSICIKEYIDKIYEIFEETANDMKRSIDDVIDGISSNENGNILLEYTIMKKFEDEFYPEPNTKCSICIGMYYDKKSFTNKKKDN
uniref:Putative conserved plasma membrane protein n=1 Tax=Nyssomyia neivai TaxID=330878 RepID=A0A1L8D9U2_9DIPT